MCRDIRYAYLAINASLLSSHPRYPMGSVIIHRSKVISFGINKIKTHPLQKNPHTGNHGFIHAELDAIIKSQSRTLNNHQIYTARLLKNNSLGNAKPCKSCREILLSYGIHIVNYSLEDNKFIKEDLRSNNIISIFHI
jgi:deoxycytidylate deaminase